MEPVLRTHLKALVSTHKDKPIKLQAGLELSWYEWWWLNQLLTLAPSDRLMPAPLDAKYFEYHSWLEEFQEFSLG